MSNSTFYGEPQSPNEGACLRCDEPPVLLQLCLQMGGLHPAPNTLPALYFFLKFSSMPEPIHKRIVSAKRGAPASLNRASPLQTSSCQQKQSPYERDAYIIIRTLGLQMGQHPQPTAKKKTPPPATAKNINPPLQHQQKTKPLPPPPAATAKKQRQPKILPPPRSNSKKHQQQKAGLTKWIGCRKFHDFRPQRNRHDHPVVEGSNMRCPGFGSLSSNPRDSAIWSCLAEHWVLAIFSF